MNESPQDYLGSAPTPGREWLIEFWEYVDRHYPSVAPTMFRQVPMYKFADSYLKGYVMFTAARRTSMSPTSTWCRRRRSPSPVRSVARVR